MLDPAVEVRPAVECPRANPREWQKVAVLARVGPAGQSTDFHADIFRGVLSAQRVLEDGRESCLGHCFAPKKIDVTNRYVYYPAETKAIQFQIGNLLPFSDS